MADITPLTVFSSAGERNTTGLTLADGFPASQKPKRQWMNWLFNNVTAKINELVTAVNALQSSTVHQLPVNAIVEIDEALTAAQFATKIGYGTWLVHGAGRVIVGAGTNTDARGEELTFANGDFSGEYRHVQTTGELARHKHRVMEGVSASGGGGQADLGPDASYSDANFMEETGNGDPMNIMQPYVVACRFKRTA